MCVHDVCMHSACAHVCVYYVVGPHACACVCVEDREDAWCPIVPLFALFSLNRASDWTWSWLASSKPQQSTSAGESDSSPYACEANALTHWAVSQVRIAMFSVLISTCAFDTMLSVCPPLKAVFPIVPTLTLSSCRMYLLALPCLEFYCYMNELFCSSLFIHHMTDGPMVDSFLHP